MRRLILRSVVFVLLSGLTLACEPTLAEVKQKHGPAVEAVFGRIRALEQKAKDAPPTTQDGLRLDGKKVALDGEDRNAVFLHLDNVGTPQFADSRGSSTTLAANVSACGKVLHGGFEGVAGGAELFMKECERAEYVFVLRTAQRTAPEVTGDKQFVAGTFQGDVLLFRLADGAALGGFTVSAQNNHDVTVSDGEIDTSRLADNLDANVFSKIREKLQALAPGSLR